MTKKGHTLKRAVSEVEIGMQTLRDCLGIADLAIISQRMYDQVMEQYKDKARKDKKFTKT